MNWKPISTAPKDGRSILVWRAAGYAVQVFWDQGRDGYESYWSGGRPGNPICSYPGHCDDFTHWCEITPPTEDGR